MKIPRQASGSGPLERFRSEVTGWCARSPEVSLVSEQGTKMGRRSLGSHQAGISAGRRAAITHRGRRVGGANPKGRARRRLVMKVDSYRFLPRSFRSFYEGRGPFAGEEEPVWAPFEKRLRRSVSRIAPRPPACTSRDRNRPLTSIGSGPIPNGAIPAGGRSRPESIARTWESLTCTSTTRMCSPTRRSRFRPASSSSWRQSESSAARRPSTSR